MAVGRVVGAQGPEAVALAGLPLRQVAMPDERGALGEGDAGLVAGVIEQAQVDGTGRLAEDREVRAGTVEVRAEGIGVARPAVHGAAVPGGRG